MLNASRGNAGKTTVIGSRSRISGKISAKPIESTGKETLQGIIQENVEKDSAVYIDM